MASSRLLLRRLLSGAGSAAATRSTRAALHPSLDSSLPALTASFPSSLGHSSSSNGGGHNSSSDPASGWLSFPACLLFAGASSALWLHQAIAFSEEEHGSRAQYLSPVHTRALPVSLLEELKAACGVEGVVLDEEERLLHSKSPYTSHPAINIADVVVYPRSQEDVVQIVKACNKHKIPVIPYGGATSVEGQILTPQGGVSIDMGLMKKIKCLHVEDMDVVVEPGIGWMELNDYLKPYGLFFPLDPGPGATIGGMCATRCSGSLAVRYGNMKDNVLSLKTVLPNGDVIKTANRARKSAAGYDLTRVFIGSEGTLGVITEVTLRLQKIPEASIVAICRFPTIKDAADVALATMHCGIQVSRVELLDEIFIRAINVANGKNLAEVPTLMFEFIGTEAYALEQTLRVQKIAENHRGADFIFAGSAEEKDELWRMRKEAFWACLSLRPDADAITTDVCVPLSKLAECIDRCKKETDASFLTCATLAHAGDGNFHTLILYNSANQNEVLEANRLAKYMVDSALELEGTCTGEHGVGVGKIKYLEKELGGNTLRAMKSIKQALDPNGIMNPGKVIPPHICV